MCVRVCLREISRTQLDQRPDQLEKYVDTLQQKYTVPLLLNLLSILSHLHPSLSSITTHPHRSNPLFMSDPLRDWLSELDGLPYPHEPRMDGSGICQINVGITAPEGLTDMRRILGRAEQSQSKHFVVTSVTREQWRSSRALWQGMRAYGRIILIGELLFGVSRHLLVIADYRRADRTSNNEYWGSAPVFERIYRVSSAPSDLSDIASLIV